MLLEEGVELENIRFRFRIVGVRKRDDECT
jgi:hypothetical protein